MEHIEKKQPNREPEPLITFLKRTKDGEFTKLPPATITVARISEAREPNYEDEAYSYSYTS